MIPYLLYVALSLVVCWLFYKLLLHKETFYRLNRVILLCCLVVSFVLPLIHVPQRWKFEQSAPKPVILTHVRITEDIDTLKMDPVTHRFTNPAQTRQILPAAPAPTIAAPAQAKQALHISFSNIMAWLVMVYWAGVIVFAINLLIQLVVTLYKAYSKQAIIDHHYRIIDLAGDKIPCSFLNTIFINPEKYDWDTYNQILLHEKVHIRQLHSLDILLAELTIIFQWFNPFAWLLRREIENNLEYLTDEEVLNAQIEPSSYQMSLLKVSAPHLSLRITTNYNQSLLKKRIIMMNAKKSNIHTLWKYFMLLPLFGGLACALNQPAVTEASPLKTVNTPQKANVADTPSFTQSSGKTEGLWFATRKKNDTIDMEFKTMVKNKTWNQDGDFAVSEFPSIPQGKKGTFTIVREAGTMVFNGSFDGDAGLGHYKFTPNEKFVEYLSTIEQGKFDEHDVMTLYGENVSEKYIRAFAENGYTNLKMNDLSAMKYFKVSAADLYFWKHSGIKDIDARNVLLLKMDSVSTDYARSIQNLGFTNITFSELLSLKQDKITPEYIKGMIEAKKAGMAHGDTANSKLELSDIIHAKYEKVDSAYIRSIEAAGYNLSQQDLYQFKRAGITAEYINELKQLGYKPSARELLGFKSASITPEYIKAYIDLGYNNLSFSDLVALKYRGITSGYLKSFEALGYKNLSISAMLSFKVQDITPDYITGFNKLGFKDIPAEDLIMLKNSGVTPQYVASMKQKGLESKDLRKYLTLKNSFKDSE